MLGAKIYSPTDLNDDIQQSNLLFRTPLEFSEYIESVAQRHELTLTQAIIDYCEIRDAEYEEINKLITPTLKSKIAAEMQELGLLEKTNVLDFD